MTLSKTDNKPKVLQFLNIDRAITGYVSLLYGLGTGVYSSSTVIVYLWKHQELRTHANELFFRKTPILRRFSSHNSVATVTVVRSRGSSSSK